VKFPSFPRDFLVLNNIASSKIELFTRPLTR